MSLPQRVQRFLNVTVRLGRQVTLARNPSRVQILLELRPVLDGPRRSPIDLRFVVDRSGSMDYSAGDTPGQDGKKIGVVSNALCAVVKELKSNDRTLLASFNDQATLDVPHGEASFLHRRAFASSLRAMRANGNTYISKAVEMALRPSPRKGEISRVVLFTDGQSSNAVPDYAALVSLADQSREQGIPLCIYGTGADYNWSLLQQLAARAGQGSYCQHVMDPTTLRGHLLGELAFLRGSAVDSLRVNGFTSAGVLIKSVTAMTPLMRTLRSRSVEDSDIRDYADPTEFSDAAGSVDVARGQVYLIEVEVTSPADREISLLRIELKGRVLSTQFAFEEAVEILAKFTQTPQEESEVDPHVLKVVTMMAAAQQARQGHFERASTLYSQAGDPATAHAMRTLHQATLIQGVSKNLTRQGATLGGRSITESMTILPAVNGRRNR